MSPLPSLLQLFICAFEGLCAANDTSGSCNFNRTLNAQGFHITRYNTRQHTTKSTYGYADGQSHQNSRLFASEIPSPLMNEFFFNGVIEMQLRRHCMLCLSASSAVWNRRDSDCWHPFVFLASHSVSVNERWDKLLFARRSSSVSLANTLVVYIASKLHVLASSCWQTNSSNNKNTNWEL